MSPSPKNSVFCALDTTDVGKALAWARAIKPHVGGLKIGLESFNANGPQGVAKIAEVGLPVFADLKLHDIPKTVAGGIRPVGAATGDQKRVMTPREAFALGAAIIVIGRPITEAADPAAAARAIRDELFPAAA